MFLLSEKEIRKRLKDWANGKKSLKDLKHNNDKYRGRIKDFKQKEKRWETDKKELEDKVKDLEQKLRDFAKAKESKRPRFPDQNYSVASQEKRDRDKSKIKSKVRGKRQKKTEREKQVTQTIEVYPENTEKSKCYEFKTRIITHIKEGKTVVVKYVIYRENAGKSKSGKIGKIKGVLPYTDYGMEVGIIVTFLVSELGLSHSKTKKILSFFCQLEVSDSQIDNLLSQISKFWKKDFEAISDLMTLASIVYLDETGWRIGRKNCFTWIFESLNHTLFLYGKNRKEEILDQVLPRNMFDGIGVSDCYKPYEKRFKEAQKCWAHFLRAIIALSLLFPQNKEYEEFLKSLGKIFSKSKKVKLEEIPDEEKERKVILLKEQILELCVKKEEKLTKDTKSDYRKFVNLQKRLVRNIDDLFTFVLHKNVEPTSNRAERGLRKTALLRNAYQTSKSKSGAERFSILTSVLTSLKQNLPNFSLESVLLEVENWQVSGSSLFQNQLKTV